MKILFTLASLGSGGTERVASILANQFALQGNNVEIICLKYKDYYYQVNDQVKVFFLTNQLSSKGKDEQVTTDAYSNILFISGKLGTLGRIKWLRMHCREEKPDVVIALTEGVYCLTLCALMGTGFKVISSERNDPKFMTWKRSLLKRIFLPYTDWLVVQTEYIREQFEWGGLERKTSIILNPVREEAFNSGTSRLYNDKTTMSCVEKIADGCIDIKENRIISVARYFPQKNQEVEIKAFAKIANKHPDWKLVIYGGGPLEKKLQGIINDLGMKNRIILAGKTRKVLEKLRCSKVFCLSSDYEGMSNSMIEAVCSGLPVVSTKVSGTEELVTEDENGYVVPIGDVDAFANALDKLISNDERLQQFSMRSLEIAEKFRPDNIVKEWMNIILKITRK